MHTEILEKLSNPMGRSKWLLAVVACSLVGWSIAKFTSVGTYLQSASANCEDEALSRIPALDDYSLSLFRRSCGMLYGGPFTVVKIGVSRGVRSLFPMTELIEIEDDGGSAKALRVIVQEKDRKLIVLIPSYAKYHAANEVFGLNVEVSELPSE
jgi:hypothetical protein